MAGIDKQMTNHTAIHTFALLNRGKVDLETMQAFLGHSNIKTTMIYAEDLEKKQALNNAGWSLFADNFGV